MTQEAPSPCGLCQSINEWMHSARKSAFALKETMSMSSRNDTNVPDQYEPLPLPPDADQLGRETWTLLHTLAAYYPSRPSPEHQTKTRQFFHLLPAVYPCNICAEHLKDELEINPPRVESGTSLSNWLCEVHNEVNGRLGKPIFDCSKVLERWKIGVRNVLHQTSPPVRKEAAEHANIYSSKQ